MERKLYARINGLLQAVQNCEESGNDEWYHIHRSTLLNLVDDHMPSCSGIDSGTELDFDNSVAGKRLVFTFGYHHMNENCFYDGWTEHKAKVYPDFDGIRIVITGPDRNFVKDYLYETFDSALTQDVEY